MASFVTSRTLRSSFLVGRREFSTAQRSVVLVDGCRIPFKTSGTDYNDYMAYDLGRMALKGLLGRTAIDPSLVDYVTFGTVSQEGHFLYLVEFRSLCFSAHQ